MNFDIDVFVWPSSLQAQELVDWVNEHHHTPEDFWEGDVSDRIFEFERYALEDVPVSSLDAEEWFSDERMVEEYSRRESDFPPIIYNPVQGSIIDGTHRVKAAIMRGDEKIKAYVGKI